MRRLLFAIAILLALAVAAWFVFRTRFAADFGTHRRGYGDTILRYEDRGYDGAKWEKLPEGEAARIAASPPNENSGHFGAIRGWDDDNYWITTDQRKAVLFRVREGTWSIAGAFEDAHESQFLRVEAPDRALFAACNTWNGAVWEVSPAGIRRLYDLREAKTCNPKEIVAVAPDLRVVTTIRPVLQIAGARTEAFDPDDGRKELHLHTRQNVTLRDLRVGKLRFARSPKSGTAYAHFENDGIGWDRDPRVGVFENGLWYEAGKLPKKETAPADMWLGLDGDEPFAVLVGPGGWIHVKERMDQAGFDQPVTMGAEADSGNLMRVWGVSPQKYWAMDDCGTVWERSGTETRLVVRGLKRDGVRFRDAWVSPTGNVYALTMNSIYRLK